MGEIFVCHFLGQIHLCLTVNQRNVKLFDGNIFIAFINNEIHNSNTKVIKFYKFYMFYKFYTNILYKVFAQRFCTKIFTQRFLHKDFTQRFLHKDFTCC